MSLAPHITEVDPNSQGFRKALATAGIILDGDSDFSVYSHHTHFPFSAGEVMVEEEVMPGELMLYPANREDAEAFGLPSCWSFAKDGKVVVMRYASRSLHERSGIDVTSPEFQKKLATFGRAFVEAGLHEILELNVAGKLFPHAADEITHEVTNEADRIQRVTIAPMPAAITNGDWTLAACWGFDSQREAVVTGMCNKDGVTQLH